MLLGILLAFLILICIALGGVVLLQRSEGGALGMGGGPSGFLTTRGAGDLLTRTTWILGGVLFALCLSLTILQGRMHKGASVVDRLKIDPLSADALAPARTAPAPTPSAAPGGGNVTTGFEAPAPQVNTAPAFAPSATAPKVVVPRAAAAKAAYRTKTTAVPAASAPPPAAAPSATATPATGNGTGA